MRDPSARQRAPLLTLYALRLILAHLVAGPSARPKEPTMPRAATAQGQRVHFWCPGCDQVHGIAYGDPTTCWTWNGDLDRPTFTPSVLVGGVQWDTASGFHKPNHAVGPGERIVCHSFVSDGRIQFLGDCTHALAGQTVDLPDWPYGDEEAEPC